MRVRFLHGAPVHFIRHLARVGQSLRAPPTAPARLRTPIASGRGGPGTTPQLHPRRNRLLLRLCRAESNDRLQQWMTARGTSGHRDTRDSFDTSTPSIPPALGFRLAASLRKTVSSFHACGVAFPQSGGNRGPHHGDDALGDAVPLIASVERAEVASEAHGGDGVLVDVFGDGPAFLKL
jgi:hypothetical protein